MSSKYEKKRKRDLDADTTKDTGKKHYDETNKDSRRGNRRSQSPSQPRKKEKRVQPDDDDNDNYEESMSIEETNKLRAKLGMAPLEVDEGSKIRQGENGETIFTEDGVEIVHKAAKNWKDEKEGSLLKERLELQKQKRQIYSTVLKTNRTLAEPDFDDDVDRKTDSMRRERQLSIAARKAKELEEMDSQFGILRPEGSRSNGRSHAEKPLTGGLTVGHSIKEFAEGRETILVLQDKGVLDDDGDEVLVNPNIMDTERNRKNIEAKKRRSNYEQMEEQIDEYGQVKKPNMLSKYDEGIDGDEKKRDFFKLDSTGGYDLDKEQKEEEEKRKLFMQSKMLETLDSTKYTLAREFYTEDEMIKFRRPKKRTKKALKASDITLPEQETEQERRMRESKLQARRGGQSSNSSKCQDVEDGEITESKNGISLQNTTSGDKFKPAGVSVDVNILNSLVKKDESDEESDEETFGSTNLMGIRIDDEAEDELNAALTRARQNRLKDLKVASAKPIIKPELDDVNDMELEHSVGLGGGHISQLTDDRIVFDATSEQYKSIGETFLESDDLETRIIKPEKREKNKQKFTTQNSSKKLQKTIKDLLNNEDLEMEVDLPTGIDEEDDNSDQKSGEGSSYTNILGEKDVTKGVAAMLKLAGQKGYLESSSKKAISDASLRKMLESKRYSKVEQGRYDIEDKTMRKLERMGTTGTGPVRSFPDKKNYKPQIEIAYADEKGRLLDSKEAFRVLSWKFHGKAPGKKQVEKRRAKFEKKERLKKMNSMDTPLGTLDKQLKKQEQLQTPYLILSGTGKDNGAPLQKD